MSRPWGRLGISEGHGLWASHKELQDLPGPQVCMFHMLQPLLSPLHPQAAAHPREWIAPLSWTWGNLSSALESWWDKIWAEHIYLFNVFLGRQALALGDYFLQIGIKSRSGVQSNQLQSSPHAGQRGPHFPASGPRQLQFQPPKSCLPALGTGNFKGCPSSHSWGWQQGVCSLEKGLGANLCVQLAPPVEGGTSPTVISDSGYLHKASLVLALRVLFRPSVCLSSHGDPLSGALSLF